MNRNNRLARNEISNNWTMAHERARSPGKRCGGRTVLAAAVAAAFASYMPSALPMPTGGQVSQGTGNIAQTGTAMTVTQTSQRLAVNWQSFNIGGAESVTFNQPNSSAIALNRILGTDPSQIYGKLTANGQVFLLNPNGIFFKPGAQVSVGGLVATTLGLSDADFMAGHFSFAGRGGNITNQGNITAVDGGYVALLGGQVSNEGTIQARLGSVALAAGDKVTLDFAGDKLVNVQVDQGTLNALAQNKQLIQADGGTILLTAKAADVLLASVVNNEGVLQAASLVEKNGKIVIEGDLVEHSGSIQANGGNGRGGDVSIAGDVVLQTGEIRTDGASGGSISIQARNLLQSAATTVNGTAGAGGNININATNIIQTSGVLLSANGTGDVGGSVTVAAGAASGGGVFSSATMSATGSTGGAITITGDDIVLRAAHIDVSGDLGGGAVLIGGDWQGKNLYVANAQSTQLNFSTTINADAIQSGDGGKVVVWSDLNTQFFGTISAHGGAQIGNGGRMEVSGKENLVFGGMADAGAPRGVAGSLLLDPKNITIDSTGGPSAIDLVDPHIGIHDQFGRGAVGLTSGNIIAADPYDSFVASQAGAVYLFDGNTGALISALTGSSANDRVGFGTNASDGIAVLTNGNFVVRSVNWKNSAATDAGAATWGSGATGVSGAVSATNSLVGSTTSDSVGASVTALTNGNYVVSSPSWSNGVATRAGAVTWGSGTTGISGAVTAANSLVGSTASDIVGVLAAGGSGVTALTNGNYVVNSNQWHNGAATNAGAVTWGNGTGGTVGVVSAANSLIGSTTSDYLGTLQSGGSGITALNNGNYVVASYQWDNGAGGVISFV